jgi:NodT family efflux transporter outer membrane factor (OMF) lipoprotein
MSMAAEPARTGQRIAVALTALALGAGVITGCAVGPDFHRPAPPSTRSYSNADPEMTIEAQGVAQNFNHGAVPAEWWKLFGCTQLDALIDEALAHNPGVEAASQALRSSESSLRAGYGIFYPTVEANASATRQKYSPANFGSGAPSALFNLFTLSTSVTYALDVFGGQRRLVESLHAQVDAAHAAESAAYLTLTANIVNAAIAGAAYRAEIDADRRLIELQREQVHIAEVQAQSGTVPYSSVLSLKSQLAANEALIPQLEQKLAESRHLLAALSGRLPSEWSAPELSLEDLKLPRDLPVSLPSELVRQRPDILIAEATAHAASAGIGIATAALLPHIDLTADLGAVSNSSSILFPANGHLWSAGAELTAPLFQGGTLWYRRKAAVDDYRQSMALYRQTVLGAFQQVADALRALEHDARVLAAEEDSRADAEEALRLVQANYRAGLANYIDVLYADAQLRQAIIADVQATAVRYQDSVGLFAALGGGWGDHPPTGPNSAQR